MLYVDSTTIAFIILNNLTRELCITTWLRLLVSVKIADFCALCCISDILHTTMQGITGVTVSLFLYFSEEAPYRREVDIKTPATLISYDFSAHYMPLSWLFRYFFVNLLLLSLFP